MDPGLCRRCAHARRIVSGKGSEFWRCAVADSIAGWPKYPPLPVLRCPRFEGTRDPGVGES